MSFNKISFEIYYYKQHHHQKRNSLLSQLLWKSKFTDFLIKLPIFIQALKIKHQLLIILRKKNMVQLLTYTFYLCPRGVFKETGGNGGSVCCVFKQKGKFPHSERPWYFFSSKVGPGMCPGTWDCLAKCYQTTDIFNGNITYFDCWQCHSNS